MPYAWSPVPASLPDPQSVAVGFYKQWGPEVDDRYSFSGVMGFSPGGKPGEDALDALNKVVEELAAIGWVLNYSEVAPPQAEQSVTRTLVETSE